MMWADPPYGVGYVGKTAEARTTFANLVTKIERVESFSFFSLSDPPI